VKSEAAWSAARAWCDAWNRRDLDATQDQLEGPYSGNTYLSQHWFEFEVIQR